MNSKQTILIVTEGETEKHWCDRVLKRIPVLADALAITVQESTKGPQPDRVVASAKEFFEKNRRERGDPRPKRKAAKTAAEALGGEAVYVWCMVDIDKNVSEGGLEKARQQVNELNKTYGADTFRLVISNPCFEYFVLQYFEDCHPVEEQSSRMEETVRRAAKNAGKGAYTKGKNFKFEQLLLEQALQRCKLREKAGHDPGGRLAECSSQHVSARPWSDIPVMIAVLYQLAERCGVVDDDAVDDDAVRCALVRRRLLKPL